MAEEISPLENHLWWMEQLRKDAKANRPEALRLADECDTGYPLEEDAKRAAAELRRLHKEVRDQHLKHIDKLKKRMKRAEALNQELLNALHCISLAAQDSGSTREGMGLYARAAIAKATGEQA
jgi:hypothetical protein